MNLLADEGVDGAIVAALRQAGHSVLYVAEMEPGIADDEVLLRANTHDALLITQDKGFWRIGIPSRVGASGRCAGAPGRIAAGDESVLCLRGS